MFVSRSIKSTALNHAPLVILLFLFVTAMILRLGPLVHRQLWEDEMFSIAYASNISSIPDQILYPVDDRPPLYYLFVKLLLTISHDKLWLRLPGLLLSLSCIPIIYIFLKKYSPTLGLIAAGVFVFSPFSIEAAWQLRDYSLLLPISLVSSLCIVTYLFAQIEKKEFSKFQLASLFVLQLLGCLVNYVYFFFLCSQLVAVFLFVCLSVSINIKEKLTVFLKLLLLHLPIAVVVLFYLTQQSSTILRTTTWIPEPSWIGMEHILASIGGVAFAFDEIYAPVLPWTYRVAHILSVLYLGSFFIVWACRKKLAKVFFTLSLAGPVVFCINLAFVLVTSYFIERSLFLPRTFMPAAMLIHISVAINVYVFAKIVFKKFFNFFALGIVVLGFLSFFYWEAYFERYPFIIGEYRLEQFQDTSEVLNYLKGNIKDETQLVFLPTHYQDLFTSTYFAEQRQQLSMLANQFEEVSTENAEKKFISSRHVVLITPGWVYDERYYPQQYIELNKKMRELFIEYCKNSNTVTLQTTLYSVEECSLN